MNLAPILLFVYNRPWHTEQTLNSLSRNLLVKESTLYIYSDGPKPNATEADISKIEEVRNVIRFKKWSKSVIIIEADTNKGLANSIIEGVTKIINNDGKVIVLEDDILTGPYFLKYMNEALDLYVNDHKVFGITGYSYPTNRIIRQDSYFLPISSSWSYATWADRWGRVNFNASELLMNIDRKNLRSKMNFNGYPFYEMLIDQKEGKIDSWAIRFYASMFINDGLFLYPKSSLVRNIGFGDEATHTQSASHFNKVKASKSQIKLTRIKIMAIKEHSSNIVLVEKKTENSLSNIMCRLLKKIKTKFK